MLEDICLHHEIYGETSAHCIFSPEEEEVPAGAQRRLNIN